MGSYYRNPSKVWIDSEGNLERFRKTLHRDSFVVQEKVLDRVSLVSKTVIGLREWLHFLKRFFRFLKDVFFQCTHGGCIKGREERRGVSWIYRVTCACVSEFLSVKRPFLNSYKQETSLPCSTLWRNFVTVNCSIMLAFRSTVVSRQTCAPRESGRLWTSGLLSHQLRRIDFRARDLWEQKLHIQNTVALFLVFVNAIRRGIFVSTVLSYFVDRSL